MGDGVRVIGEVKGGWVSANALVLPARIRQHGPIRFVGRFKSAVKNSFRWCILRQYFGRSIRLLDLYVA
jgi:hypothetical protein